MQKLIHSYPLPLIFFWLILFCNYTKAQADKENVTTLCSILQENPPSWPRPAPAPFLSKHKEKDDSNGGFQSDDDNFVNLLLQMFRDKFGSFNLKDFVQSGKLKELDDAEILYENVSNPLCKAHMRQFYSELSWSILEPPVKPPATWALQMLDAWGGLPDGILSGHLTTPGDFPECLQIRGHYTNRTTNETSTFRGRYTTTYMIPNFENLAAALNFSSFSLRNSQNQTVFDLTKFGPLTNQNGNLKESVGPIELLMLMGNMFGVVMVPVVGHCFPSSCSMEDAQTMLQNAITFATCEVIFPAVVYSATDEKPPYDSGDITMIVLLSIIAGLCLLGTTIDLWMVFKKTSTQNTGVKAMMAFSVYTNTRKWLNTSGGGGENFGCMHGLRFLSMAWVVLCHTFLMVIIGQQWNLVDIKKMYADNWTMSALLNGFVSVDTFFAISGTLACYNILKALDRSKGRLNVPLLYIHRYCRLTPTYMILVGIMATVLPYISEGPTWYVIETESKACEVNWWHNLLYITNLVKYPAGGQGVCFGEAWYLSNDMQFFIVSPLIIYPLWRWKRVGLAFLAVLSLVSIVTPAVITGVKHLPPTGNMFTDQKTYEDDIYHKPWTRIGPYLVGIFLGYVLHDQSQTTLRPKGRRIPKWVVLVGWLVSTGSALAIVFGMRSYFDPAQVKTTATDVGAIAYAGLHRFVWGMIICWIIYACVNGHGGWVNDFLSWKPFIPLGRLTFCVYISSLHIQMIFHTTTMHPWHYSPYIYVNMFFAHLVMSLLIGYVLTITLESPFIQLEKLIFQSNARRQPPQPSKNNGVVTSNGQVTNGAHVHGVA